MPDSFSQGSVPGYQDAALNRNRLLRDQQGEGVYKIIGTFKVTGTPYLFGGKLNGNLFSVNEKANNIDLSYNTYNQELEFFSTANPTIGLTKLPGEVDSFVIKQNIPIGVLADLMFIYGPIAGSSEKAYFQLIEAGQRFTLYKRYKSDLGYVSSNYTQTELRQFDLLYDYFYYDADKKKFKKIKINLNSLTKEFKDVKDLKGIVSEKDFDANPEVAAKKVFWNLNH
jgi:hypothetical protein